MNATNPGKVANATNVPERDLAAMRVEIDSLDNALIELLDQRMKVCREIGQYKIEHNIGVVQSDRFSEILQKRSRQGAERGMDPQFIKDVFTNIHDESCRQQEALKK